MITILIVHFSPINHNLPWSLFFIFSLLPFRNYKMIIIKDNKNNKIFFLHGMNRGRRKFKTGEVGHHQTLVVLYGKFVISVLSTTKFEGLLFSGPRDPRCQDLDAPFPPPPLPSPPVPCPFLSTRVGSVNPLEKTREKVDTNHVGRGYQSEESPL